MKIVIAVLALMPSLVNAQSNNAVNRPLPDTRCGYADCIPPNPNPWPHPRPTPCRPWQVCDDVIVPLSAIQNKAASLTAAIADGKFDQAGESLNGLFSGAGSKEKGTETSSVAAGAWTVEPRVEAGLSKFRVASPRSRMPLLVEREDGKHEAKMIPVGAGQVVGGIIVDKVIDKVIEKANDAATKYVERDQTKESIEKYGGCRMKGTCPK